MREARDCREEMTIRARVILRPTGHAMGPTTPARPIEARGGRRRIHQPREHPFSRSLSTLGQREIIVLDGRILAKLALPCTQRSDEEGAARQQEQDVSAAHRAIKSLQRITPLS